MKKRSPYSTVFFVAIIVLASYAVYYWIIEPMRAKRAMEKAMEKGCEAVAQKFESEKDEIVRDLANLIEKIKEEDVFEAEGPVKQDDLQTEEEAK